MALRSMPALLPHRDILLEPFVRGIPPVEAKLTPAFYPLLRYLFTLLLQLSPNAVTDALEQTTRIVDDVDHRIADGRRFLWGDSATLSDLAFATALAPLLLPDGYTAPIPTYAQMPAALRQLIDAFRRRPCLASMSFALLHSVLRAGIGCPGLDGRKMRRPTRKLKRSLGKRNGYFLSAIGSAPGMPAFWTSTPMRSTAALCGSSYKCA
jgi:hypothetical protein